MAQDNEACLMGSYADSWNVLQQLITSLLFSTQEHTNLPCDSANSNKGAPHPCMRRKGGQPALKQQIASVI